MTSSPTCGLLVAGGGPAGHTAAATAARLGMDVVLVEREYLGGTCLNRGCIPTKLFLGATAAVEELDGQRRLKIADGRVRVDLPALQLRKERLLAGGRKAVAELLKSAGVVILPGDLRELAPGKAVAATPDGPRTLAFEKCILATGSRPASFPALSPDGRAVLDSNGALALDKAPESLIVIGAGAVGLELADFFHRLGTRITLLDGAARVAPAEEPDVSTAMARALKRKGWVIRTGVKVAKLETVDGRAELRLDTGEDIQAEKALVAVGRFPNSNISGLADLGVSLLGDSPASAWISVDDSLTAAPNIYAVGDVNGQTLLAHAASHQAVYAARHAAGLETEPYESGPVPSCIYGSPEVIRVGDMARTLKNTGRDAAVSESPFAANPIAQAHAAVVGFVRVVWSEDRVAGITAIGCGATGLATLATVAVQQGWRREDAERIIFPHPTPDETLRAALLGERKEV